MKLYVTIAADDDITAFRKVIQTVCCLAVVFILASCRPITATNHFAGSTQYRAIDFLTLKICLPKLQSIEARLGRTKEGEEFYEIDVEGHPKARIKGWCESSKSSSQNRKNLIYAANFAISWNLNPVILPGLKWFGGPNGYKICEQEADIGGEKSIGAGVKIGNYVYSVTFWGLDFDQLTSDLTLFLGHVFDVGLNPSVTRSVVKSGSHLEVRIPDGCDHDVDSEQSAEIDCFFHVVIASVHTNENPSETELHHKFVRFLNQEHAIIRNAFRFQVRKVGPLLFHYIEYRESPTLPFSGYGCMGYVTEPRYVIHLTILGPEPNVFDGITAWILQGFRFL